MQFLTFLGSVRTTTPPRPARLGERVALACQRVMTAGGHPPTLIDPLTIDLSGPFKPHFAYAAEMAPPDLEELADRIRGADGYIMVSPEYNHAMSPALADLLNHFGSSHFSFKPSAIVTYSAGQWGGTRAAVSMRTFLSELGCLPVSAMIHVPKAHEVFSEDGRSLPGVDADRWDGYFGRTFDQLVWWARAARAERAASGPATGAFVTRPDERNAPG